MIMGGISVNNSSPLCNEKRNYEKLVWRLRNGLVKMEDLN
jgi:hypothetical protein